MPMIGLMANTQRQPSSWVSTPPRDGPMARPTAAMPVQAPMARVLACGSAKAAPTRARLATLTTAAPTPWRPRDTLSTSSSGASAQPSEAAQKIPMPTR